ncbi:hypothetical protein [Rickettsia massiliae]|uniref:hypothetical protein n=1 Tax=Rickettsia massiliae TaxID=35791 RepID=UPI000313D2B4|nr:hypothetical protein [Rickettsia massiliae]
MCTIGIHVISAEYDYINTGLSIAENVYLVDHFIENPILEQANIFKVMNIFEIQELVYTMLTSS